MHNVKRVSFHLSLYGILLVLAFDAMHLIYPGLIPIASIVAIIGFTIRAMTSPQMVKYEHHGTVVWVRSDLKGHHRDICNCYNCIQFNPTSRQFNCPRANKLFQLCVDQNMTTPVLECPDFKQRD